MALFYWLIDVKGWSRWAFFFVVIGTNAILVYFGQQVVDFDGIARFFLTGVEHHVGMLAPLIIPIGGPGREMGRAPVPSSASDLFQSLASRGGLLVGPVLIW